MNLKSIGIENKLYLLLLLPPVLLYLFLYLFRKKVYYISILSILGSSGNSILRKVELALFYLSYIAIVLFLSRLYIVKSVNKDNILLVVDSSYTTSTKFNDADRFSYLIAKAKDIAKDVGKKNIYYIDYDIKKRKISEKMVSSDEILNLSLLKFFIDTNLSVGNTIIFFTDGSGDKPNMIEKFKDHRNFYYYIIGSTAKNYCISRIRYTSKFLWFTKVIVYLNNYGIDLPDIVSINGKKKKIKNNVVKTTLPFHTKFLDVKLKNADESYIDNHIKVFIHNSNFALEYRFKQNKNTALSAIRKKIRSSGGKKIVITDGNGYIDSYRVIYAGFSSTQRTKKVAFHNISYFDREVFKNINQINFIKKDKIPQFMFLEGIPLLATNSGYLILSEGNHIYTSFGINDNITINKFWHTFLWKRIIEYAAKDGNIRKSNLSFYGKCDLSPQIRKEKEFVKEYTFVKYSLQAVLRNIIFVLIPLYLLVFLLLYFL